MKRKLIAIVMCAAMAFTAAACGNAASGGNSAADKFRAAIDLDYAKTVQETISQFGDDPALGFRSSGSPAEMETVEYLKGEMESIGLQNVTVDEFNDDGWTFRGANLTFTNADGKEQTIDLGGYQTDIHADNEECEVIYVGQGTAEDYEDIDVAGKLVLLDVDQNEDWWINYPAYQAHVKGAKAVLANSLYPIEEDERIGTQDICGPANAPALGISAQDSRALQDAIEAGGSDTVKVVFNADSTVISDNTNVSHNVWGEIPGTTDETIFVFAHLDGYFHSAYDDAEGAAVSMAQAKAIIDSGYTPNRTIRFCFHGSEEWGVSGSEYDWSKGAYEDIVTNHPDWVEGAVAIVNNDGGYTVEGVEGFRSRTSMELRSFTEDALADEIKASGYEWEFSDNGTYTEDFMWTRLGVPAIVAGNLEDDESYEARSYHSSFDGLEHSALDEKAMEESIFAYGKIILDLDASLIRPMSFTDRIGAIGDSMATDEYDDVIADANAAAEALEARMAEIEESGDAEAAIEMNKKTQEIYIVLQDAFLGLDYDPAQIIRHELYQDSIENLEATIECLEKGDIQEAYDEYLWAVEWAWYYMNFDDETCKYMENQLFDNWSGTWGEGLIRNPFSDLGDTVRSLGDKYDDEDADVSAEIAKLKEIVEIHKQYLADTYAEEMEGLAKATELMQAAAA